MVNENRKLAISGIAGVLVACLTIISVVIPSWTPSDVNAPQVPPELLAYAGALSVRSFVSNLTEPLGVGSEGILTVVVTSTLDASNVVVQFDMSQVSDSWPLGIDFIVENLTTWSGNLKANVSMIFNARIRAVEAGLARLLVTTIWYLSWVDHVSVCVRDMLCILVQDNDIQVSHYFIAPPGQMPFLPPNDNVTKFP